MREFLINNQLNIMLGLACICGITGFFSLMTRAWDKKRKLHVALMQFSAMLLLLFDRYAYLYRGKDSVAAYYMVRISNFIVFAATILTVFFFNRYIEVLSINEGGFKRVPRRLIFNDFFCMAGILLLVISQFTGLYYTFNESNQYVRSSLFLLCYIVPVTVPVIDLTIVIKCYKKINNQVWISLLLFSVLPLVSSVIQFFAYGISLTDIFQQKSFRG